jgi:WbqC-like protein family
MKTVAIVQSSYIPWKGFFDIINSVDEFILLDDVQFTKRDWRSRNSIKTSQGTQWLTIPVSVKGKFHQKINQVTVSDPNWAMDHWKIIQHNYHKAPFFNDYAAIVEKCYQAAAHQDHLSQINFSFIKAICAILSIRTTLSWSTDYVSVGSKSDRLISLCKAAKATRYLSGPKAANYIEGKLFDQNKIELIYINYDNYQHYSQLYDGFDHNVTILDLLFNTGPQAVTYLKSNSK